MRKGKASNLNIYFEVKILTFLLIFYLFRCVEAIQTVGGSLDAATEYLLSNPIPLIQQAAPTQQVEVQTISNAKLKLAYFYCAMFSEK